MYPEIINISEHITYFCTLFNGYCLMNTRLSESFAVSISLL